MWGAPAGLKSQDENQGQSMFGKYHIVIFKERSGVSRSLRLRGASGFFACLLILALMAGNVWMWQEYRKAANARDRLETAQRTIEEQNNQILGLAGRIAEAREDLERVRRFDARLRLMLNMERDPEMTSLGGARSNNLSSEYLPLHRQELMARRMNAFLRHLADDIRLEEASQQELLQALRGNREILASMPSIWPVEGFITSRFGARSDPFTGRSEYHKGLDISARTGTPVYAPGKGVVIFSGVENGYGQVVRVQHGGGIITCYAHLSRRTVNEGQQIRRGDIIGHVGSTGRSSGPHLHYEVRLNGINVDPLRYILN